jgi:hypothetical protein
MLSIYERSNLRDTLNIGIWFAQVSDMCNKNLWMSCVWEDIRDKVINYLKKDNTLWDKKWLFYLVLLISNEGFLILGPETGEEGELLIMPKEQPESFSMRGYGNIKGRNIIFVSTLVSTIINPKNEQKEIIQEIENSSIEGLYYIREFIKYGFEDYNNAKTTILPVEHLKTYGEKLKRMIGDKNSREIIRYREKERDNLTDSFDIISQSNKDFDRRIVFEIGDFITLSNLFAKDIIRLSGQLEENLNYERNIYSCAIFGEPGSGKSFIARELIKSIKTRTGEEITNALSYNLSQFESKSDLIDAFKRIQEYTLKGEIPFVIWDEFDSYFNGKKCGWLSSFLMPMQDSKFFDGSKELYLGKSIFVFIGGTFHSEEDFIKEASKEDNDILKIKDFHSRLDSSMSLPPIDIELEDVISYKFTEQSCIKLEKDGLPEDILKRLKNFGNGNRLYIDKNDFVKAIEVIVQIPPY